MPATLPQPIRGEVWLVDLEPTVGDEIGKVRPVVVINVANVGRLALRMVVPLTSWQPHFAQLLWLVLIPADTGNGLSADSGADTFQTRCVSLQRFIRHLGAITDEQMDEIATAIKTNVGAP
jgi:mRNA interferase MazF